MTASDTLPKLVVFDLDRTLWSFHVDKMKFPFKVANGAVVDDNEVECPLFPDVIPVLSWLKENGIGIAVASRVRNIAGGYLLLHLHHIRDYFWPVEIYPTPKTLHFQQIARKTGLQFDEMLFFDDDKRNLKDLLRIGLPCVHVPKGLNSEEFMSALTDPNQRFNES